MGSSVVLRGRFLPAVCSSPKNQNPPRLLRRVVELWDYCFLVLHPPWIGPHALSLCGHARDNRDRNREGESHKPMAESNGVRTVQSTILDIICFNAYIRYAFLCGQMNKYSHSVTSLQPILRNFGTEAHRRPISTSNLNPDQVFEAARTSGSGFKKLRL